MRNDKLIHHSIRWSVLLALLFARATPLLAVSPEAVDNAINRAKAFLYSQQNADGSWEKFPRERLHGVVRFWGGHTAIVTYALLAAGDDANDPRLAKGINFLKTEDIRFTYAVGLRSQVWLYLNDKTEARRLAARDAKMLLAGADAKGHYDYDAGDWRVRNERPHNSTSQYGVLGMWACAQLGIEIPDSYWRKVEAGWRECQGPTGAWTYFPTVPNDSSVDVRYKPSATMTVAGIASLLIAQEGLHAGTLCKGNVPNEPVARGFQWISNQWPQGVSNPYLHYGIERVGLMSGYKYIGTHDWYKEGAEIILRTQQPNGDWPHLMEVPLADASLNVIFLARGRAPVILNKLAYDVEENGQRKTGRWAQRPHDCWNLINWLDRQLEARLKWQVVDINNASQDDLLEAPVLFISGNEALNFTPQQRDKLKKFVEDGGLILGNADCDAEAFSTSFSKLGAALFPGYEFRLLPDDHPIFARGQIPLSKWRSKVRVRGLSNGVREVMLLPEADLSKSLQARDDRSRPEHFELAKNIILYATDKTGLRAKAKPYVVRPDPAASTTRQIKIARVQYTGNWDPEPGGWRRLAAILRNNDKIDVAITPVKLGPGGFAVEEEKRPDKDELRRLAMAKIKPEEFQSTGGDTDKMAALVSSKVAEVVAALDAAAAKRRAEGHGYAIAHLTGSGPIALTAEQRTALKQYVDDGGLLVIDAAGGDSEFSRTIEAILTDLFGREAVAQLQDPLPPNHPLYTTIGTPIEKFLYRSFAKERLGSLRVPQLRGIVLNGRLAVIMSREDISGGLVGQQTDGIMGYDPETATAIMRNVLISTITPNKPQ